MYNIYVKPKKKGEERKMNALASKIPRISGNTLKIIAAISMLIDHVGIMFFPGAKIFRILGRLAFPIFAFMIAEGCRYTKNKLKYFSLVFGMGLGYTLVFYIYARTWYFCILFTFALSIMTVFALQAFKNAIFSKEKGILLKLAFGAAFVASVVLCYLLNHFLRIDYGFVGCMIPVIVSLFHAPSENAPKLYKKIDRLEFWVLGILIGAIALYAVYGGVRIYSLLAVPLLLLYSGKRGKRKMKYFFYIFYPAHLLALEGLYVLVDLIK
jgi:hypothetical protein